MFVLMNNFLTDGHRIPKAVEAYLVQTRRDVDMGICERTVLGFIAKPTVFG